MNAASQARAYELIARLLREDDREQVIHQLLASCLHGPEEFGALLPHLPADLLTPRARLVAGARRASQDLDRAADALDLAALTVRHSVQACEQDCPCRAVRREGVDAFLLRTAGRLAAVLCASSDPYYQHLGEILDARIQLAGQAPPSPEGRHAAVGIPAGGISL